jgi:xylan 1,4-beta-xylosidase
MSHINPIIEGCWADPYVMQDGEDYYLYPTKDSTDWQYNKFFVFHSKDLIHWEGPILALDLDNVTWANHCAWAPGVTKYNEKYYMYFSAESQIGVAVSDSPLGPFVDLIGKPLIKSNEYGCQSIDADPFIDDDGQPYLLWGQGKCWIVPLEDDMFTFKSEPVLLSNQIYEAKQKDNSEEDKSVYNEGPHLKKYQGKYWLTWSNYDTRDPRYQIAYAFSSNIYGPYEVPDYNRLTAPSDHRFGTGHATLSVFQEQWYLFYHRLVNHKTSKLREVCCTAVQFIDGKPSVNVD